MVHIGVYEGSQVVRAIRSCDSESLAGGSGTPGMTLLSDRGAIGRIGRAKSRNVQGSGLIAIIVYSTCDRVFWLWNYGNCCRRVRGKGCQKNLEIVIQRGRIPLG